MGGCFLIQRWVIHPPPSQAASAASSRCSLRWASSSAASSGPGGSLRDGALSLSRSPARLASGLLPALSLRFQPLGLTPSTPHPMKTGNWKGRKALFEPDDTDQIMLVLFPFPAGPPVSEKVTPLSRVPRYFGHVPSTQGVRPECPGVWFASPYNSAWTFPLLTLGATQAPKSRKWLLFTQQSFFCSFLLLVSEPEGGGTAFPKPGGGGVQSSQPALCFQPAAPSQGGSRPRWVR